MKYRIVEYADGHYEIEYKKFITRKKLKERIDGGYPRSVAVYMTKTFESIEFARKHINSLILCNKNKTAHKKVKRKFIYSPN